MRPRRREPVEVEVLYFDGCPNHAALVPHLRGLLARQCPEAALVLRRVADPMQAERERFLGSPTVRVDGRDVDPGAADRADYGLRCRLYATAEGLAGAPPDAWILAALERGRGR